MADPRTEELREVATHRGLRLVRSRRRKAGGDFGLYGLADQKTGEPVFGFGKSGLTASDEEIENYLRGQAMATWQSSLKAAGTTRRKDEGGSAPAKTPKREAKQARARPVKSPNAAPTQEPTPEPPEPPQPPRVPTLRKATARDVEAIDGLIGAMKHGEPSPDLKRMIATQARQGLPLLVADDGKLIGFVATAKLDVPHQPRPIGRILTLLVARDQRRSGIGSMLLEAAEEQLRKEGCARIEATGDLDFDGAGGFFRARGYGRATYRFDRELD